MTTSIVGVVLELNRIGRVNEALEGENAALRAAISRIQNLHQIGTYYSDVPLSRRSPFTGCVQCEQAWPCPTITAIGTRP